MKLEIAFFSTCRFLNKVFVGCMVIALVATFASCSDFLTMTPRGEKVVRTAEDYRDVMASYVKMMSTPNCPQQGPLFGVDYYATPYFDISRLLAIYSNEVELNDGQYSTFYDLKSNSYNTAGYDMLAWKSPDSQIWNQYYALLGPLNLIISDIDSKEIKDINVRNMVVGEALVWRAYAHYKLLQYYSPYKDGRLGIPMFLNPTDNAGNAEPERENQSKVYAQIIEDLNEALRLLEITPTQSWNFAYRKDFIHSFMADIYWYKADGGASKKSDWKEALTHAEQAMRGHNLISGGAKSLGELFDCSPEKMNVVTINDEFFIRIVDGYEAQKLSFISSYYVDRTNGKVTQEYLSLYGEDDIRKSAYITSAGRMAKYNLGQTRAERGFGAYMPFRLANAYLIAAEAAVHCGDIQKAVSFLKAFKMSRYTSVVAMLPTDSEALLTEIRLERKKEFFAEIDARWLAMKRYGESFTRSVDMKTFTLASDDFRYTFPIPYSEISTNKKIEQNPGWN